jgi:hypothetical protein
MTLCSGVISLRGVEALSVRFQEVLKTSANAAATADAIALPLTAATFCVLEAVSF